MFLLDIVRYWKLDDDERAEIVFRLQDMSDDDRWVRWGEHGVTMVGRAVYVTVPPPRPMLLAMAT